MERHPDLLSTLEPAWQAVFRRLTTERGFVVSINDDPVRLTYGYASRYDRVHAYEPVFYRAFAEAIEQGMTVLDIGSHVGLFALAAGRRVGRGGKVYAFEPAPDTAAVLERHIALNGYADRIEVVRAVVCDTPGTVPFYARGESMAASLSRHNTETLTPERCSAPTVEILTPSTTIDQFCADRNVRPDVVKIDVEGAELAVLRGAKQLLSSGRSHVLCEVHPAEMTGCGASLEAFHAHCDACGWQLELLDEPNQLGIFHVSVLVGDRARRTPADAPAALSLRS